MASRLMRNKLRKISSFGKPLCYPSNSLEIVLVMSFLLLGETNILLAEQERNIAYLANKKSQKAIL